MTYKSPTVFIAPKEKESRRSHLSGKTRGGFPVEEVAPWLADEPTRQDTSAKWQRERDSRERENPFAKRVDVPEHKLRGGERTEVGRQIAAFESERAEKARQAREVAITEKALEDLKPPRKRRKR